MWRMFDRALTGERAPAVSGQIWFNDDGLSPEARARARAGKPLSFTEELAGIITLIDFWDYSCVNCVRTLPYVKEWWRRYKQYNFLIIGVHTPEFEFGRDPDNVESAVLRFELAYPVVSDPEYVTWKRYGNNVWPRKLLVDHTGIIRYDHRGEGAYQETERGLQTLLQAQQPKAVFDHPVPLLRPTDAPGAVCYPTTPEIYLGYQRGRVSNPEGLPQEQVTTYTLPRQVALDQWALHSSWRPQAEEVVAVVSATKEPSAVVLHYQATEVYAVMRCSGDQECLVTVEQDGEFLIDENRGEDVVSEGGSSVVHVSADRLYRLVKNPKHGQHVLKLTTSATGLALHTFTFGSSCIA
ncbi:MAG: redoxin family protein [Candidatus Andersenbacteria bacterium]